MAKNKNALNSSHSRSLRTQNNSRGSTLIAVDSYDRFRILFETTQSGFAFRFRLPVSQPKGGLSAKRQRRYLSLPLYCTPFRRVCQPFFNKKLLFPDNIFPKTPSSPRPPRRNSTPAPRRLKEFPRSETPRP